MSQAGLETRQVTYLAYTLWRARLIVRLVWIWSEVWIFAAMASLAVLDALGWRWVILVAIVLFKDGHVYETRKNIVDTARELVLYQSRTKSIEAWQQPKYERIEFDDFIGWYRWTKRSLAGGWRTVPFDQMTLHVRRKASQGGEKWLPEFADYAMRFYRYTSVDYRTNYADPNVDIIQLNKSNLPDKVELVEEEA